MAGGREEDTKKWRIIHKKPALKEKNNTWGKNIDGLIFE